MQSVAYSWKQSMVANHLNVCADQTFIDEVLEEWHRRFLPLDLCPGAKFLEMFTHLLNDKSNRCFDNDEREFCKIYSQRTKFIE